LKTYSLKKYQPELKLAWDDFVRKSKNGTFLFQRDFMDYHQHRFDDFSLLLYKKEQLIAILPANRVGNAVHSHQGLTYGGLLLSPEIKFKTVLEGLKTLLKFLHQQQLNYLWLKEIPSIYHRVPSEEVHYFNFILEAQLVQRDALSVIDNKHKIKLSKSRLEGITRGKKHDLRVVHDDNFKLFWNSVLIPNLRTKHQVEPVHSLAEIQYLKGKFPEHIKQFNVYHNDAIVAGATIFETPQVAHCQYISGNVDKNSLGSLDLLHEMLINEMFPDTPYFDFGTSNGHQGLNINQGLQFWKEGFGARTLTQDTYKIETKNYRKLAAVLQ